MADDRQNVVSKTEGQPTATFHIEPSANAGDVPTVYSNFIQVGFSPHDFRLHLGVYSFPVLSEPPEGQVEVPVEPVLSVAIPLNLARGLVRALETSIANWEKGFNEPVPDQPHGTQTDQETP
jgi:hypothetical protein